MSEKSAYSKGRLAPGRKIELASLAPYRAGAVVSRTILSNGKGTVTLLAFDEGQGLSEHTAKYNALLHLLEGEADITVAGDENHLEQGNAIILPAGKSHAVWAAKRFKMLLTVIRSE